MSLAIIDQIYKDYLKISNKGLNNNLLKKPKRLWDSKDIIQALKIINNNKR